MHSFNQLKKNVKKDFTGLKKVKLAILADSASQLLHEAIRGYGYEMQMDFDIYEADYNQIEQQIYNASSELYAFAPEYIFILRSSEHALRDFYHLDKNKKKQFSNDQKILIQDYVETVSQKLKTKIITNTLVEINDAIFGNYAAKVDVSFLYQVRKANLQLMDLGRELGNLFICDFLALQSSLGYHFIFDPKMYILADLAYSIDFLPYIAKQVTDIICTVSGTFKKCLILDLDNTIWGGIIGDDGMEGIQIGNLGIGKAFTELQLWARELKQRGIILCVCSKNTEEIAKEPFEKHPDMVLRLDDIAVFVANWENKTDNIRYIQQILNIGFDSMVFLDDNPFEREMVHNDIPEINIPELPEDPAEYLKYLRMCNLFETASFTNEDEERTQQYREEAKRNILQKSFTSNEDFLKNLNMKSDVRPFDKFTTPRVAQLTQRSNQFNLRTVRYTEEEIHVISRSPEYMGLSFTLEDKFGDHGLICVIILKIQNDHTLFIDTWVMSCRVLKRGMENFTLNLIALLALEKGFKQLTAEYIPTNKNGIVKNHYADLGFTKEDDKWILDLKNYTEKINFIIKKYGAQSVINGNK